MISRFTFVISENESVNMKNQIMSTTKNELKKIYEMMFVMPGMYDNIKVELRISRKHAFLLAKIIERGIDETNNETLNQLLEVFEKPALDEIRALPDEVMKKAGLTDLNEKLKALQ